MAKNKDKSKNKDLPPFDPRDFVHQPHDKYVRYALQIRALALEFLQFSLEVRIRDLIDWDTLQLSKDSFIDEKLKAHYSDICYTGYMIGKEPFRIATLIEHKSDPPGKGELTLQLVRYISNIWQDDIKHNRSLTLTIPIVLYHGNPGLKKETVASLFAEAPDWSHAFIPSFDYVLVDLSIQTDEALDALKMMYLGKFLTALKHSRDNAYIAFYWKKFVIFAPTEINERVLRQFAVATVLYLNATSTVFNQNLKKMDTLLTTEEQTTFKPYLIELYEKMMGEAEEKGMEKGIEKGMEKGIEKGMEKGIEKGMEKGIEKGMEKTIRLFLLKNPDWTDRQVADCFEVTPTFVHKLRTK